MTGSCLEGSHSGVHWVTRMVLGSTMALAPAAPQFPSGKILCHAGDRPLLPRKHQCQQHFRQSLVHFPNPETCGFLEISLKISVAYSNGYTGLVGPISLGHDLSLGEFCAHKSWMEQGSIFIHVSCVPFFLLSSLPKASGLPLLPAPRLKCKQTINSVVKQCKGFKDCVYNQA